MTGVQIKRKQDMLNFLFAGNATFTLMSLKTLKHETFNVSRGRKDRDTYFVHDSTGHAIGTIKTKQSAGGHPVNGTWKRWDELNTKSLVFGWWWYHMDSPQVELFHVGKCGRCNRPLTDPTSISRGIGPECAKQMNLDIPDLDVAELFK